MKNYCSIENSAEFFSAQPVVLEDADAKTLRIALREMQHTPIASTDIEDQVRALLAHAEAPAALTTSSPIWRGNITWISGGRSWSFVVLPSGRRAWVGLA